MTPFHSNEIYDFITSLNTLTPNGAATKFN